MDGTTLEETLANNVDESYCRPYTDVRAGHDRLVESLTTKAAASPVYAGRVHPITEIASLGDLPITTWADIERAFEEHGLEASLLTPPSGHWETSGYTGEPKKFYYSEADIEESLMSVAELMYVTGALEQEELSSWHIGVPDPLAPGSLFDRAYERFGNGTRVRQKYVSTQMLEESGFIESLKLASKLEGLDVMSCFPIVFFLIAQAANHPEMLEGTVARKISEYHVPGWLARRIARIYVGRIDLNGIRKVIERVKFGYTFGEHLGPYEKELAAAYPQMTIFNIYGSTEHLVEAMRLDGDADDLSCILKGFIPEIAEPTDVETAKAEPGTRLEAKPWYEWEAGTRGELLITRPGECLPLVRYPTGDIVEVVEREHLVEIERWGRHHTVRLPLIRVLGRSVDVVDFETPEEWGAVFGYSFYTSHVSDALTEAGGARWWELYRLPGAPGRLLLWVILEGGSAAAFEKRLMKVLLADEENLGVPVGVAVELDVFDLVTSGPEAYVEIERTVEARIREGRPLGRIKPKHIYKVADEAEYGEILASKRAK